MELTIDVTSEVRVKRGYLMDFLEHGLVPGMNKPIPDEFCCTKGIQEA